MDQQLLVAYHDIWPGSQSEVVEGLKILAELGFGPCALMVVPNWHGKANLQNHPEFVNWLKELSDQGHLLFMHGYRHITPEVAAVDPFFSRRQFWGRFVNQHWVDQQAELAGLSRPSKLKLLHPALEICRKVHLCIEGFTAPTWWGALEKADLKTLGMRWQDRRFFVDDAFNEISAFSPAIAWPAASSEPTPWGGKWLYPFTRPFSKLRLALHPGDLKRPFFKETLLRWKSGRAIISYRELIRSDSHSPQAAEIALTTPMYPL